MNSGRSPPVNPNPKPKATARQRAPIAEEIAEGSAFPSRSLSRSNRARRKMESAINITPFVDVMLVLLIVFMVTAPLLTIGIKVDLPHAQASALSEPDEPLTISIDSLGRIYIQDHEIDDATLEKRLRALTEDAPARRLIYVRGDKAVPYGRMIEVMARLERAGFTRLALVATPRAAGG